MDDLVKRLNRTSFRFVSSKDYKGPEQYLINPDGPDAVAALTAAQAEAEKLRGELVEVRAKALEEAATIAASEADEHWATAGKWRDEGNEEAYDRCAARGRTAGRIRDNIRALKGTGHG